MKIFPSILSADFSCLRDSVEKISEAGTHQLHLDVMDGHFVPNISFGFPVIRSLVQRFPEMNWDAHLMISEPKKYMGTLMEIGMDWVSFHIEVDPPVSELVKMIREGGGSPGIAINPDTPVEAIRPHLSEIDYVVLMTVQPGFGGQSFRESVLDKIKEIRLNFEGSIQVDGGINADTIKKASASGVDWFVSGSSVFGEPDPGEAARKLLLTAESAASSPS